MGKLFFSKSRLQYLFWPIMADNGIKWHIYEAVKNLECSRVYVYGDILDQRYGICLRLEKACALGEQG